MSISETHQLFLRECELLGPLGNTFHEKDSLKIAMIANSYYILAMLGSANKGNCHHNIVLSFYVYFYRLTEKKRKVSYPPAGLWSTLTG